MKNQEYEQKRRECWEEFKQKSLTGDEVQWPLATRLFYIFCAAFDRAYALGKQFGNSEQVDIEEAAEKHADELRVPSAIPGALVPMLHDIAKSSYLQGAQDFIGKQETKQEIKQETDVEETVIQGWVARDGNNDLNLYFQKPIRNRYSPYWAGLGMGINFSKESFPDLTWESDPIEVELIIKRKKK